MSDNGEETTTETEGSFESFTSQALRLRQKGSFELLLSQHLASSVVMPPFQKIRLILESCYMVPTDKLDLNMKMVRILYVLTQSFLCSNIQNQSVTISWGFPQNEKNYQMFIKPWRHQEIPLYFTYDTTHERLQKDKLLEKAETTAKEFFLFTCNLDLSIGSFQILKVEFLQWAVPIIMELFSKISKIIEPDLYKSILETMKPQSQGES